MSLESLRKVQCSKKSSMSMPLAVKLLEEHHERLLKLEALAGFKAQPEPEPIEELPEVVIPKEPEPKEEPVPELVPIQIPEEEVIVKLPEEVIEEENLLDSLLHTLARIQDEASLVEEELKSIKQMENEPEEIEDDCESLNTECTEACQEILDNATEDIHIDHSECKNCMKAKAKAYKKEKKRQAKERAQQAKLIKQKEKDLLLLEQKEIAIKLSDLRNGLNNVEVMNNVKNRITREYEELAQNYYQE